MANIGVPELLLILLIILLLFGASRLPKVARGLGQAVHELRRATADDVPNDAAAGPAASGVKTPQGDD